MSRAFQRFKGVFKRNLRLQPSPAESNRSADREQTFDRISSPQESLEEKSNIIEDDIDSFQGSNGSQRSQLNAQIRRPTPLRERSPSIPSNRPPSISSNRPPSISSNRPPSISSNRPPSTYGSSSKNSRLTLPPITNTNRNVNSPVDIITPPVSNLQNRIELPVHPAPKKRPNKSSRNRIPPSTVRPSFTHLMIRNRLPFRPSPNSTLIGFASHENSRWHPPSQSPLTPLNSSSFPAQNNSPNFEFDYPIKNVFIDEHISPSLAIKVNEAVGYDRFGRTYYTHHYAYEPKTQHIRIGNNQHIQRRLMKKTSHQGLRYIREIPDENSYSEQEYTPMNQRPIIETISPVCYQICSPCDLNLVSPTVQHFSAYATPNDPMRL